MSLENRQRYRGVATDILLTASYYWCAITMSTIGRRDAEMQAFWTTLPSKLKVHKCFATVYIQHSLRADSSAPCVCWKERNFASAVTSESCFLFMQTLLYDCERRLVLSSEEVSLQPLAPCRVKSIPKYYLFNDCFVIVQVMQTYTVTLYSNHRLTDSWFCCRVQH